MRRESKYRICYLLLPLIAGAAGNLYTQTAYAVTVDFNSYDPACGVSARLADEPITGDRKTIQRRRIDLAETGAFGGKALKLSLNLKGKTWVRFEA